MNAAKLFFLLKVAIGKVYKLLTDRLYAANRDSIKIMISDKIRPGVILVVRHILKSCAKSSERKTIPHVFLEFYKYLHFVEPHEA